MKKLTSGVLVFYGMMLILQSAAPCFADEKWLEGKIAGTGPRKVWLMIGSNHGVTEGMLFEVRHEDKIIAKIKIKKVGASSSEAEIIGIASEDVKISPGDMARWILPPEFKETKEETTTQTPTPLEAIPLTESPSKEEPKTEPAAEVKTEIVPSTPTPVEMKKEESATITKVEPKKEETVTVKPAETKKEQTPKKTVKKKSGGIFGKKMWLYAVIAGAAAFALSSGGSKSSGSTASPSSEAVSSSSDNTPSVPF